MKKLISSDEAKQADRQHKVPCSDCPLRKDSVSGWLGGTGTPEDWVAMMHGEARVNCHAVTGGWQCAGVAIYRTNVAKNPRDKSLLVLPADREKVFVTPQQFVDHHKLRY